MADLIVEKNGVIGLALKPGGVAYFNDNIQVPRCIDKVVPDPIETTIKISKNSINEAVNAVKQAGKIK